MRMPLLRLGRAIIVAATIVAASGMLETIGRPLFAEIGEVTLNLAATRFEEEKLRQKVAAAAQYRAQIQKVACQAASDRYPA